MEAKELFFRLSYEQYKKGEIEEREKWELEVAKSMCEVTKVNKEKVLNFIEEMRDGIQLMHSNSIEIELLFNDILRNEKNQNITSILDNCWIASWDWPNSKNANVYTRPLFDGSYLVRINTEYLINLSKVVWLYSVIVLSENLSPYTDFRNRVSLNNLLNKFVFDLKNDTEEGSLYLIECYLTPEVKSAIHVFVLAYYRAALTFIMMHEIGHILELDTSICDNFHIESSSSRCDEYEGNKIAENNADQIGYEYSNNYIVEDKVFNMGPTLAIFTLAINHKCIKKDTDHPSIKNRYERALNNLFENKQEHEIRHVKKLLSKMGEMLQKEKCWNEEDCDWWRMDNGDKISGS